MRLRALIHPLGLVCALGGQFLAPRSDAPAPTPRAPVVVELFSSEGCSSCPPADAYVAALDRAQPVDGVALIALEEHVDYWDYLGWRDPFGSNVFSDRQQSYARALDDHRVFTPEIVFDGHLLMPNGDEGAARASLRAAALEPKARVSVRRDGARVAVEVTDVPAGGADDPAEVVLAIAESDLVSEVAAGENAGKRLAHAPVVRRLQSLGRVEGSTFRAEVPLALEPAWRATSVRVVALVQRARSRRIVGAAAG